MGYEKDRHPFETAVVKMVNKALTGLEESMIKQNAQTESQAANAEEDKRERSARRIEAAAHLEAKSTVVVEKKAAVQESEAALVAAKAELVETQKTQKRGDAVYKKVADEKDVLDKFQENTFVPLKDTGAGG